MSPLPTRPSPRELADAESDARDATVFAVLQSRVWRGPWSPPPWMHVMSVLGSVVLDYRDAELLLGETALRCDVVLGSVEILVPPDVDVEVTGAVVLGSVETRDADEDLDALPPGARPAEPDAEPEGERPLLHVHCAGALGSVTIRLG